MYKPEGRVCARQGAGSGLAEVVLGETPCVTKIGVRCGGGRLREEAGTGGSDAGVEGVGRISDPRWQFKESLLS